MKINNGFVGCLIAASLALTVASCASAPAKVVYPSYLKQQANAEAVVAEHLAALNAYDVDRLMAQFPEDIQFHSPGGVVKGRAAMKDVFVGFCKTPAEGGLNGLVFTTLSSFKVGDTITANWKAEAPFLEEPYVGSDAYITKDGLLFAMVSTFNGADLKFKK